MNETSISLEKVKHLIKHGKRKKARSLLREIAKKEPHNDEVFVLFAYATEKREHAIYCLEQAIKINPNNEYAQQFLYKIQKTTKEIVRQDQSPHESQSRPNELESLKKKMEKIRNWPRWLRYGLIPAFVPLILTIPWFIDSNLFLFSGPLAPSIFLMILGVPDFGTYILFIATPLYWFLIGGLIGTFTKDAIIAGVLWSCVLVFTWVAGVLFYLVLRVFYN